MNKNDLIFDWSSVEVHSGWKGVSLLVVVLGFGFLVSLINVEFGHREVGTVKSASVLFLSNHEEGETWSMLAEEEGPFPGRLEISGLNDPLSELGDGSLIDRSWNPNRVRLKDMEISSAIAAHRISAQGQRYFPRNFRSTGALQVQPKTDVVLKPNLIPYTKEAQKWLPAELPLFRMEMEEEIASAEWRFVLNLRADGSVMECLSLSGGRDEALTMLTAWLKSIRFQESQEPERWMGLRLEFLNEGSHGSDSK